jgi:hypothetical protein
MSRRARNSISTWKTNTILKVIRLFLAALIIIGICLVATYRLWVPTLIRGLLQRQVATYQEYSLLLKNATPDASGTGEYSGILILDDNKTGQEFTLENEFDNVLPVELYVDSSGTYAELSIGTSFARDIIIYKLSDNPTKVAEFCAQPNAQFWSNYAIYLDCENTDASRPWEEGAPDIGAINLVTGASSTLVASSPLSTYFEPMIVGNSMSYQVASVPNQTDWLTDGQYINNDPPISTATTTINIPSALRKAGI